MSETSDGAAVLEAQRALSNALRMGNKVEAAKLLAPQFTWIDENGNEHSRADVLGDLAQIATSAGERRTALIRYGAVAMVSGRCQSPRKNAVFFIDIWVKGPSGWRVLVHHDNMLAAADAPATHAAPQPRPPDAEPPQCRNPCSFVPYTAKSSAERGIITAFQTLENAVTRNDAAEWVKHMADEFVVYRTNQHPTTKAGRAAAIERQRSVNAETWVAQVKWMKLWVYGDTAVMRADHVMPGNRRPPYRATRVWLKRGGHWQMAMSQQTTVAK